MAEQLNDVDQALYDASQEAPEGDILVRIGEAADGMDSLDAQMKELADKTKILKARHTELSTQIVPGLMAEAGIEKVTTASGLNVVVKPFYSCRITGATEDAAYAYLQKSGNMGLIKTGVTVDFAKGSELVPDLMSLLEEHNYEASVSEKIHPKTLESFVRGQIEDGVEGFPQEAFNVFMGSTTKLKRSK